MNWDAWLPVLVVASSLLPGLVIFFLREGCQLPKHFQRFHRLCFVDFVNGKTGVNDDIIS